MSRVFRAKTHGAVVPPVGVKFLHQVVIMRNKLHTWGMDTKYDIACKRKFYELLETHERQAGYSPSQLLSVMIVMECDKEKAMSLIDEHAYGLDWSEATWTEMRDYFMSVD